MPRVSIASVNLTERFLFFIPGIRSIGAFELATMANTVIDLEVFADSSQKSGASLLVDLYVLKAYFVAVFVFKCTISIRTKGVHHAPCHR